MSIIAVDLAARYSAAIWMTPLQPPEAQWTSADLTESAFVRTITAPFLYAGDGERPDQLVIEDLPHGVPFRTATKHVCQIQGRIAERMDGLGLLDLVLFVAPNAWRNTHPVLRKRNQGMDAVVPIACEYGYVAPDLAHLAGPRGGRALVDKVTTDFCAAFLIGMFAFSSYARCGTYDVPGTNRYAGTTMRKDTSSGQEDES